MIVFPFLGILAGVLLIPAAPVLTAILITAILFPTCCFGIYKVRKLEREFPNLKYEEVKALRYRINEKIQQLGSTKINEKIASLSGLRGLVLSNGYNEGLGYNNSVAQQHKHEYSLQKAKGKHTQKVNYQRNSSIGRYKLSFIV